MPCTAIAISRRVRVQLAPVPISHLAFFSFFKLIPGHGDDEFVKGDVLADHRGPQSKERETPVGLRWIRRPYMWIMDYTNTNTNTGKTGYCYCRNPDYIDGMMGYFEAFTIYGYL